MLINLSIPLTVFHEFLVKQLLLNTAPSLALCEPVIAQIAC